MRWGTNEMGNQWDGDLWDWGSLGLADDGVTNEKGDQWNRGPMIWGTNEMGDQWAPIMYWGTNEMGDQWKGDQWDGGPMRGGTNERIPFNRTQSREKNPLVKWAPTDFMIPKFISFLYVRAASNRCFSQQFDTCDEQKHTCCHFSMQHTYLKSKQSLIISVVRGWVFIGSHSVNCD